MNTQKLVKDKIEAVQDGSRFSHKVENITKNKAKIKQANKLEKQAYKNALEVGIMSPHEIIESDSVDPELAEKLKAEKSLEQATGFKAITFKDLERDDIEFINDLEEDESKYMTIKSLFGKKIAKEWKKKERLPAVNGENTLHRSEQSVHFVKLYKENYEKILAGKTYKTDTELKKIAGYADSTPAAYVKRLPWVALKIKNFHDSQRQIEEYHLKKVEDTEIRQNSVVSDITMRYLAYIKANPTELEGKGIRDTASFLKVINDLNGKDGKDKGPSVNIQINQDMASVFSSQNQEKKEHLEGSF